MSLIRTRGVGVDIGAEVLLEQVELAVDAGERVCLAGRNGAGKSTLLAVLAGEREPDTGSLERRPGLETALLPQVLPADLVGPVQDIVTGGLGRSTAADGWDHDWRIGRALEGTGIAPEARFESLSGGQRRRVLLAGVLAAEPDLLLLDEPTNHLDLPAIDWLERALGAFRGGLLFTTHDRAFLRRLATRIVDIDRGRVTSWPGDYANFLRRREERWEAEEQEARRFDRRLAQEETWIRSGLKARRIRNMGRVRRLLEMRRERRARRERPERPDLNRVGPTAERTGKRVIEAEGISFAFDGAPLVEGFSCLVERGDRVGIIGPNGAGKTTLLRLLAGELRPAGGRVRHGTRLRVAYFDQERERLPEDATVMDAVLDGGQFVTVGGESIHVLGHLRNFLFSARRAREPVRALSGGERNRLLLARLFARPANLLVLDEPTNDLDLETLEVLEERLGEFEGTLLLASHDRAFLDNLVTSILVLEGGGRISEHVGGHSDWLEWCRASNAASRTPSLGSPLGSAGPGGAARPRHPASPAPLLVRAARPGRATRRPPRLSWSERRELEALPAGIEALEGRIAALHARLADPAFYRGEAGAVVAEVRRSLATLEAELEEAFARWSELEDKAAAPGGGPG